MKMKVRTWEIIIIAAIILAVILPQVLGTATVTDVGSTVDERGIPVADKTFEDYEGEGTRFALIDSTDWHSDIMKRYPKAEISYYGSFVDEFNAVESGAVDVALGFTTFSDQIMASYPDLAFIKDPFEVIQYGFGTHNTEKGRALCSEFNKYLADITASGDFEKLKDKWEDPERTGNVMGTYHFSGEKGVLKVSTGGGWEPMTFYYGDELTGFFVELVNDFCSRSGYTPEIFSLPFESQITGLMTDVYDLVADTARNTEDRPNLCATEPIVDDPVYFIVRAEKKQVEVSRLSLFISKLEDSIRRNYINEKRYMMVLSGLRTTIGLSILSILFGTLLGALICFLRMSKHPAARACARIYIRLFRGIPLVVLLMVMCYIILKDSGMPDFWIAVIAFSLDFSAYCAEIFRSGIESVAAGQMTAARALGFSEEEGFLRVVWPQALTAIIPVYSGQINSTVKMTSVAGYVAVAELTKVTDIIRSRTFDAFIPLFVTTLIYFLISALLIRLLSFAEKQYNPQVHKVSPAIARVVTEYDPAVGKRGSEAKESLQTRGDMPVIEAEHLVKSFGDVTPLKDISFAVNKGDVISVIGPSGTGKSTLLLMLNQLVGVTSGKILVDGEDCTVKGYDLSRLRRKIGMVFQSFNLFSHLSVIENITLAQVRLLGRSESEAARKGMELLEMVGLAEKALNLPGELSGGQQQRVAIARTLAMDPEVILFDEPTSALDPTMVGEVVSVIRRLAKSGCTMIIVTHEMKFARDISTRVFYLDQGLIFEEGSPEEIFLSPKKELTKRFIRKIKVFEMEFRPGFFDYPALMTGLEQFGFNNLMDPRLVKKAQMVSEELVVHAISPAVGGDRPISLLMEYDEGAASMDLKAEYEGENADPLSFADELTKGIILNSGRDYRFTYEEGKCTVIIKLS
ncbi:MAG: ABC transporter permease subunit [Lachnospiraceae bacterium]|nr:ABC transporter permease subunit [Lachnospiraceae bacterium]